MKIAVIGSGISGLSASWLISQYHKVYLFEKKSYYGGHANTQVVKNNDKELSVDTGFIVFNEKNYPNLCKLFENLDVKFIESDMSFSVSRNKGKLEYSGSGFSGIFAQKKNFLDKDFIFMLYEIIKFYKFDSKHKSNSEMETLSDFLKLRNYSDYFKYNHIYPMAASIWSSKLSDIAHYPVNDFLTFFKNHNLFNILHRPKWRTVAGGSKEYVKKILNSKKIISQKNTKVKVLSRTNNQVILKVDKKKMYFDKLVVATHTDQAIKLLGDLTRDEENILGGIKYSKNKVYFHKDEALMPKDKKVWSSWNFLGEDSEKQRLTVSYWMNKLQNLQTNQNYFVTLNPFKKPINSKIIKIIEYSHPMFTFSTFQAQELLKNIQGNNNTWFCGAYTGFGFHEDGIKSGLHVAEQILGEKRPW